MANSKVFFFLGVLPYRLPKKNTGETRETQRLRRPHALVGM